MRGSALVSVVTALDAEAKPIAEAWCLERHQSGPFPVYRGALPGPRNPVEVIVAGVGRAAAAAGTAWLAAGTESSTVRRVWINYGIGGAATLNDRSQPAAEIGDVLVAGRVMDEEARRRTGGADSLTGGSEQNSRRPVWYPPWIVDVGAADALRNAVRGTVRTVDAPEIEYADDGVYEMEAVGFVATALRFQTAEFVQVVKVVSDTPTEALQNLDRQRVINCSKAGLDVLTALATELVAIADGDDAEVSDALARASTERAERVGLTVAQRHLWNRQIERLEALVGAERAADALQRLRAVERRAAVKELTDLVGDLAVGRNAGVGGS